MHLQDSGQRHPDLQRRMGRDVVGDGHQGIVSDIQPLEEREAGEYPGGQRPHTLSPLSSSLLSSSTLSSSL